MNRILYDYEIDVYMCFVPTKELNSRGNPKCKAIYIRNMYLTARKPGNFTPDEIKIFSFRRNGENRFSFSKRVEVKKDLWPTLKLIQMHDDRKWKKYQTLDEMDCIIQLEQLLGSDSMIALHDLLETKPEKRTNDDEWEEAV